MSVGKVFIPSTTNYLDRRIIREVTQKTLFVFGPLRREGGRPLRRGGGRPLRVGGRPPDSISKSVKYCKK